MTTVFRTDFKVADKSPLTAAADLNGGVGDGAVASITGATLLSVASQKLVIASGSAVPAYVRITGLAFGAAGGTVRVLWNSGNAGGLVSMAALYTAANGRVVSIGTNGSKQFVARNNVSGSTGTNGGPWVDDTDYALEFTPTNSTGSFKVSAYQIAGDGTEALVWTTTAVSGNATSAFDQIEVGKNQSVAAGGTWQYDYALADDRTNVYIGPDNVPPTLSLTPNQNVSAGAAVSAAATAGDIDGSIVSYAWSVVAAKSSANPSLTGASTATVSFTAPAAGNLVTLQCVVTDNGGLTKTMTTEVRVPLVGSSINVKPLAGLDGTSVGTWPKGGGATTDGEALTDGTDTKFVESPTLAGTEVSKRVRLQPTNALSAATTTPRLQATGSGFSAVVRLYEGGALRQSWTVAVTTSAAAFTCAWDPATIAAITDWGNLYREVAAS